MVEGRGKPRSFAIAIKWVASVDIMALRIFVKYVSSACEHSARH